MNAIATFQLASGPAAGTVLKSTENPFPNWLNDQRPQGQEIATWKKKKQYQLLQSESTDTAKKNMLLQ